MMMMMIYGLELQADDVNAMVEIMIRMTFRLGVMKCFMMT